MGRYLALLLVLDIQTCVGAVSKDDPTGHLDVHMGSRSNVEQRGLPSRDAKVPRVSFIVVPLIDEALDAAQSAKVVRLTAPEDGVFFDIDGDVTPELVSWPQAESQERLSGRSQKNGVVSFILVPLSRPTAEDARTIDALFRLSTPQDGVLFDIDADGSLEQVSWPAEGSQVAFLAIDRNMNGRIDDGAELFGAQTIPKASDGFTALNRIEQHNQDGALTKEDSVFGRLLLWTDHNRNGRSDPGELAPLSGIFAKIGLGYFSNDRVDMNGNNFENRGWAVFVRDFNDKPNDLIVPIFEVSPAMKRAPYR